MPGNKRKVPEIPGGSMADIAFLLLIFFLVATTMDVDTGITRKLPPMPDEEQQDQDDKIKERNIFIVLVNRNNDLLVEGERMSIRNLRATAKQFIANPQDKSNLPEKTMKEIPYFGQYPITEKHVISLQNDRGTSYETYISVQNELAAAYRELRNELAQQKFGKKFDELDKDRRDAVQKIYPNHVSEAEPKNVGG